MHIGKFDPAFPTHDYFDEKLTGIVPGLTKREYFAALALQGLLANPTLSNNTAFDDAKTAVEIADALIARLNES